MRYFYSLAALLFCSLLSAQIDTVNFESPSPLVEIGTSSGNIWQIGKPGKVVFDSAFSAP